MYIDNALSDEDFQRITQEEITPLVVTGAHVSVLEACDVLCQEILIPFIQQTANRPQRQVLLIGLLYRMLGFAKTAIQLRSAIHQQSLTSAERSVIELWIDIELLHRDAVQDGVAKAMAFVDYQKLRAARRVVRFYERHPELDTSPSQARHQHTFVQTRAAEVENTVRALWNQPHGLLPKLDHWTNMSVEARAGVLGIEEEQRVIEGYDLRNFSVHTGLASVIGLPERAFEIMCSRAAQNISACMRSTFRIIGRELSVYATVDVYDRILSDLDRAASYAIVDHVLRARGEPQRYRWQSGPPPA